MAIKRKSSARKSLERIEEIFDLPSLAGSATITLTGERRVHIENHHGVLAYERDMISVSCGDKIVHIYGQKLELRSMSDVEMLITGDVARIELM
jgi:sporulation protein YqfC